MGNIISWSCNSLQVGNNKGILKNYLRIDLTYLISACRIKCIDYSCSTYPPIEKNKNSLQMRTHYLIQSTHHNKSIVTIARWIFLFEIGQIKISSLGVEVHLKVFLLLEKSEYIHVCNVLFHLHEFLWRLQ